MTTHPFSKKRSQLRKLLYAAAAVILLGSLLASYMHWEANHLEFNENTALPDVYPAFPAFVSWYCRISTPICPCWKKRQQWRNRPDRT